VFSQPKSRLWKVEWYQSFVDYFNNTRKSQFNSGISPKQRHGFHSAYAVILFCAQWFEAIACCWLWCYWLNFSPSQFKLFHKWQFNWLNICTCSWAIQTVDVIISYETQRFVAWLPPTSSKYICSLETKMNVCRASGNLPVNIAANLQKTLKQYLDVCVCLPWV